jgi:hypothetical protein
MVQKCADWMRPVGERILETMADEGNLTPRAVSDFDVTSQSHASNRLGALVIEALAQYAGPTIDSPRQRRA